MSGKNYLALGLILVGMVWFLTNQNYLPGFILLYVFSAAFFGAYLIVKKTLGFLIPAALIAATAIFTTMAEFMYDPHGGWLIVFLGLSFISIFLIHTRKLITNDRGEKFWPWFPGIILTGLGSLLLLEEPGETVLVYISQYLPLAIILVGVVFLFYRKKT